MKVFETKVGLVHDVSKKIGSRGEIREIVIYDFNGRFWVRITLADHGVQTTVRWKGTDGEYFDGKYYPFNG